VTMLVSGLMIFFTAHVFTMFRGARQRAVDKLGVLAYRGVYSLVSIAGFVLIVKGYGDAARVDLWVPAAWMRQLTMLLMLPVFVLIAAAYMPGFIKAKVKNPMLIALKTWAFAHLLANGDIASVMLFGSFLVWAVVDLIAVKRTNRSAVVAHPRALFDGLAVIAGLAIYTLIVLFAHPYLAGVALTG
jgi:uncharacterized membrane protein